MADYTLSDIAAATGENGGFGGRDGGAWWLLVLFLLIGGFGGNGWGNRNQTGGDQLYPWMNQAQANWQGVSDIQQAMCSGFAGVNANVSGGFAAAEAAESARQLASMQQAFASQTAIMQGLTGIQSQLAQCCCDNRLATANQTATILSENCADRAAISDGVRDIIASQTAGTQRILDQMCSDKIDAKNEEIANLRTQLNMMNLAASQNAQTAALIANNEAQTTALEQYLAPVPRPAYVVQNPNCCQPYNCGCGGM